MFVKRSSVIAILNNMFEIVYRKVKSGYGISFKSIKNGVKKVVSIDQADFKSFKSVEDFIEALETLKEE